MDYFLVLLFVGLSAAFVLGGLGFAYLIAPHKPGRIKNTPYECGEQQIGGAWIQFNVGYYLFGLLFLVFDVEAAFLYPWAVAFRDVGLVGLVEALIFLLVLIVGLVYAWKKSALEWV
ncbi:MAG: NADH-quinone oxidoreductase subunit A [Planctomycetota bacterium]|jgi:NADH:ubiquinone oxidoreductase subunit 3 (subunit A)|nr:NADH-quinone oxidoreductase subunit A [Planctomycetota bacterium]